MITIVIRYSALKTDSSKEAKSRNHFTALKLNQGALRNRLLIKPETGINSCFTKLETLTYEAQLMMTRRLFLYVHFILPFRYCSFSLYYRFWDKRVLVEGAVRLVFVY